MARSNGAGKTSFARRVRALNAKDVPAVTQFMKRTTYIPAGFAYSIQELLQRLIFEETLIGVAVDYIYGDGTEPEPAAFGISGFINEASVASYLDCPSPCISLMLLHRALVSPEGSPFLTLKEVAQANAGDGLTLVPLFWFQRSFDPADPEAHALLSISQQTFLRSHQGYRLSRVIKEVPAHLSSAFAGGGFRELCRFPAGTPLGFLPEATLPQDHVTFIVTEADVEENGPASMWAGCLRIRRPSAHSPRPSSGF
jgi:hypothetical protein